LVAVAVPFCICTDEAEPEALPLTVMLPVGRPAGPVAVAHWEVQTMELAGVDEASE